MTFNFNVSLLLGALLALLAACSSSTPTLQDAVSSDALVLDARDENLFIVNGFGTEETRKSAMVSEDAAKDGDAAALRCSGEGVQFELDALQSGRYRVLVHARADEYGGYPTLRLRIDGEDVADKSIEHEGYGVDDLGTFDLKEGQRLEAFFLDDAYDGPGSDRNLYIDYLELEPQSEPPTQPDPGEPGEPSEPGDAPDVPEGAASIVLTDLPPAVASTLSDAERSNDDFAPELQAAVDYLGDKVAAGEFSRGAIRLPAGEYALGQGVSLRTGVGLYGDGASATSVTAGAGFPVLPGDLNDSAVDPEGLYRPGYLFNLDEDDDVTFQGIAFSAPNLLGAIVSSWNERLSVSNSAFNGARWSAIRLMGVEAVLIERNTFLDAGGVQGGGGRAGAIFGTWVEGGVVRHNLIDESDKDREERAFGVKGRQWRNSEIAYNTVLTPLFSVELPFENDHSVEIHHNVLNAPVSFPKAGEGGVIPDTAEYSFYLHHNVFFYSYSLEGPRNDFIVEENIFAFSPEADGGNLVSTFGNEYPTYPEGMVFRRNMILNPGRGIFWSDSSVNGLDFENNHVYVVPTQNDRTTPMFDFNPSGNLANVTLADNIIEMDGVSRPLFNGAIAGGVTLRNNKLVGVSDAGELGNPQTGAAQGIGEPLRFAVGVDGAYAVDSLELLDAARQGEDLKAIILR